MTLKIRTAVEWYYEQTVVQGKTNYVDLYEQAKAMEKEQMIDFANKVALIKLNEAFNIEQFYDEMY
jgi:tellurite resistance-related uncharacterized protein